MRETLLFILFLLAQPSLAQDNDTIQKQETLEGVTVTAAQGARRLGGASIGQLMGKGELFRAACCNLGESFVNNPSVDVNYSDATTGAKQIRLLGLSGIYVQMLTENLPNFRGAAAPYALGYVPGAWMKSIQVSKGTASVKNGYEAMTGQINVQYLQPEDDDGVGINLYGNTQSRFEANLDGNVHITPKLSTEFLGHFENKWGTHDENDDTFQDSPNVRQYNFQNRWDYLGDTYIFHGGLSAMTEQRDGGQTSHHHHGDLPLYQIGISTDRYEGYMKHAFVLDPEHGTNIALMTSASMHLMDANYGHRLYSVNEKNAYAQLMFETKVAKIHELAFGASFNHDYFGQNYRLVQSNDGNLTSDTEKENVVGGYAQYTLNLNSKFIAMAGLRLDHSSRYGNFLTPRFHLKWQLSDIVSLRASAGKGYRSPHALAENNYLLGSGRTLVIEKPEQEEAWNLGTSIGLNIPLWGKTLTLNAEYFYTKFHQQYVIDYDRSHERLYLENLRGHSYSHVFQIDGSLEPLRGLTLTAAYRRNIVRAGYGEEGKTMDKPLQSRYKGLLTASYKTHMGIWQFDATLQMNGGGRMPAPYTLADGTQSWSPSFKGYEQLSLQVTRWFPHFSVYIGGENLTNFRQKHPVIGYSDPWGKDFDSTLVWGPVHGAMAYIGIRYNLWRL